MTHLLAFDAPAALVGAIMGGIAGACVGLMIYVARMLGPGRRCPECGEKLPRGQRLRRGGWICPACDCEVDQRGLKVKRR